MRRRLAAVLAADIAGYTRLMGADEDGTLAALRVFRSELFGPAVAAHRGRVVKSMGDGWLVEFVSSVDAVNCAMQVQDGLAGHGVLRLRIGVHIGDIVHEDEDIFGDGVNISARLQEIAPPGGIALSASAYDSLDGTLAPAFADAGIFELKNVARPVHVWLHAGVSGAVPNATPVRQRYAGFPGLAILPVMRPEDRSDLADLCDALTGDLVAYLGSSDWLRPRVTGASEERDYVLSPNLRARGDQIRLEVQVQSPTGDEVWSAHYDGTINDSFTWQDEVGIAVAANTFGSIFDTERHRLFAVPEDDLSSEDCLLFGVLEFYEVSAEALTAALHYLEAAMIRSPDLDEVYAQAVRCVFAAITAGYRHGLDPYLPRLPDWLRRAAPAGERSDALSLSIAIWRYLEDRDADTFTEAISGLLRRSPFDADVLCLSGWGYVWLGQPEKAIDCFRKFERYGRFSSYAMAAHGGLAMAMVQAGRDGAAIEKVGTILRTTRDFSVPFRVLAAAAAHIGRIDEARDAAANALRLVPDDSISSLRQRVGLVDTPANERFLNGLRLAGYSE